MTRYQIKDNLLVYLNSIELSINKLEQLCGFSSRYLSHANFNVPADKLDRILRALPGLNREWLLSGKGEMMNNYPTTTYEKTVSFDTTDLLLRATRLLEMEGLALWQYEEKHQMKNGAIEDVFKSNDLVAIDNFCVRLLREYPKYSFDWLFHGDGPAWLIQRRFVRIVQRPSELISNPQACDGRFMSFDPSFMDTDVSFALELKWDDLSPYANFGDVILCHLCEPSAITKDDRNLYVVEYGHADQEPDLRYGYLKLGKKGISVIPLFELSMSKMGKEDDDSGSLVLEEDIIHIARIVGVVHKFRMR